VNFPAQYNESKTELLNAVAGTFEKGDFILGEQVSLFEKEFSEISQSKYSISVANGTDALILGLKVLGVQPGDEVITASNSWISSASAIALIGAKPVFADVQWDQNISPKKIEEAITKKTKAIMPVHLTGRCADMPEILAIGEKYGIPIIEDAAQAVAASVHGITAGSGGKIGCFSLHPLKNLNAAGDAGIMTTQDPEIAHQLTLLRHHGLKNRDEVEFWGYNSRLDTIQAAVLRTRVHKVKEHIKLRRAIADQYNKALSDIVLCPKETPEHQNTYHVYVIRTEQRDALKDFLATKGIETKIHYPIPIHLQKAAEYLGYKKGSLPETEKQSTQILSLPVHPYLSQEQVEWVIGNVKKFFQN
jgi:dTDP-4-amino-4,6-dideoxygalactose transaminase